MTTDVSGCDFFLKPENNRFHLISILVFILSVTKRHSVFRKVTSLNWMKYLHHAKTHFVQSKKKQSTTTICLWQPSTPALQSSLSIMSMGN